MVNIKLGFKINFIIFVPIFGSRKLPHQNHCVSSKTRVESRVRILLSSKFRKLLHIFEYKAVGISINFKSTFPFTLTSTKTVLKINYRLMLYDVHERNVAEETRHRCLAVGHAQLMPFENNLTLTAGLISEERACSCGEWKGTTWLQQGYTLVTNWWKGTKLKRE